MMKIKSTKSQSMLLEHSEEICKTCKHLELREKMFYCKYFEAILEPETLTIPCEFRQVK